MQFNRVERTIMPSVNKVIIVGHLGHDPEMRALPSGEAVASMSVATTDTWKDKAGEKQEATEWHRVVFFGRQAEVCGQYLKKGSLVYVEGSLRTRKWQGKDGNDRQTTEIRGEKLQILSSKNGDDRDSSQGKERRADDYANKRSPSQTPAQRGGFADMDDDPPF